MAGGLHAGLMRRVNHQHRMELETHWSRLDVAHSCQKKGRENVAIGRALFDPFGHLFDKTLPGCLLNPSYQWLDFRAKLYRILWECQIFGLQRAEMMKRRQF